MTKKGKHRIPMDGGDEYDAFTGGKRRLRVFYNNSGLAKAAKRSYWKRDRRKAKEELSEGTNV